VLTTQPQEDQKMLWGKNLWSPTEIIPAPGWACQ